MSPFLRWVSAFTLASCLLAQVGSAATLEEQSAAYQQSPEWLGPEYLSEEQYAKLDALAEQLAASGELAEDGRPQLYKLARALAGYFETVPESFDWVWPGKFKEWRQRSPTSALVDIAEAMQVHALAWRARGHGFSSSVTPEGWKLFAERNARAWELMVAAKNPASPRAIWYQLAIDIALDADRDPSEVAALFNEGIKRFPDYFPLYFSYARQYSPRWGGSYQAADTFIRAQVAAKTNHLGDVLYTRLYWLIDQYNGADPDFFSDSRVDWIRMRTGFQSLMKQFPKGAWNQANFVSFACRAGDGPTYFKWRKTVDASEFQNAAPDGISLEICDARFTQKT
jgi:hypothetical protein